MALEQQLEIWVSGLVSVWPRAGLPEQIEVLRLFNGTKQNDLDQDRLEMWTSAFKALS